MADGSDALLFELEDVEISEWLLDLDSIELSWLLSYVLDVDEAPLPPDLAYEGNQIELLDAVNQPVLLPGNGVAGGHRRVAIWRHYRWGNSSSYGAIELSPLTVVEGLFCGKLNAHCNRNLVLTLFY